MLCRRLILTPPHALLWCSSTAVRTIYVAQAALSPLEIYKNKVATHEVRSLSLSLSPTDFVQVRPIL